MSAIGNMDEIPHWMEMPGDTTVEQVGAMCVTVRTTGHDKACFTVVLGLMVDWCKLEAYIVLKGVHHIAELSQVIGVVEYCRNGRSNEGLGATCVRYKISYSDRISCENFVHLCKILVQGTKSLGVPNHPDTTLE